MHKPPTPARAFVRLPKLANKRALERRRDCDFGRQHFDRVRFLCIAFFVACTLELLASSAAIAFFVNILLLHYGGRLLFFFA